jgi:hypothetical protein
MVKRFVVVALLCTLAACALAACRREEPWEPPPRYVYGPPAGVPPGVGTADPAPVMPAPITNAWLLLRDDLVKAGPPAMWPLPGTPSTTVRPPPGPLPAAPSARALELASAINAYRVQNGLPAIAISRSLMHVAETHVADLRDGPRPKAECNGHSWSQKGTWTACCYTADHAQAKCMWDKPVELTGFEVTGYEIAIGRAGEKGDYVLDATKALELWKSSPAHHDVILNRGHWQYVTWRSLGTGIADSHASAWFADEAPPASENEPAKSGR